MFVTSQGDDLVDCYWRCWYICSQFQILWGCLFPLSLSHLHYLLLRVSPMRRLSWSCQSSCHKEWFKCMITATHVQTILLTVIYFNYRDVESGHPPIDLKNALLWYVPEGIFTSIARDLHTLQSCSFRRQTSVWSRLPKIIHDCLSTGNGGLYIDWQYGILSSRTCSRYPQPLSCHYWCSERWKASFLYRWVMVLHV